MGMRRLIGLFALAGFVTIAPAASAAANGKLAYGAMGAIYSVDVETGATTAVHSGSLPAFSPDGTHLVFAERTPADGDSVGIWVANADGSSPVEIGMGSQPHAFAWSPDGTRIAFVNGDYPVGWTVVVMKTDGSGSVIAADDASPATPPSWSPDGTALAYTTRDNADIAVAKADGTGTTRLIRDAARDVAPAWSPDGSRIAFFRESFGGFVLYAMNANGSGLEQLGRTRAPDPSEGILAPPAWSPDGSRIAFGGSSVYGWSRYGYYYKHDVYSVRADGADERELTDSRSLDAGAAPFWSPDGRRIAFLSSRAGISQVFDMNANGSCETQITTTALPAESASWQSLPVGPAAAELTCAAMAITGSIDADRTKPALDDDRIYVYRGSITNNGNIASGPLSFHTASDGSFAWVSATATNANCSVAAGIDCTLPSLLPGASTSFEIRFRMPAPGWHSLVGNTSAVDAVPDGDQSDNRDGESRYFPFCEISTQRGSTVRASIDDDLICGTVGPDRIYAGGGLDRVRAGGGHDVVHGGADRDWLFGGGGSDYLYGDSGTDRLHGEEGNDVLSGGPGDDQLWGDAGGDFLRGGPGVDQFYAGYGNDVIDARDGARDHVYCGEGKDIVKADLRDVVSDCEVVVRAPAKR
jgi:TolB protein